MYVDLTEKNIFKINVGAVLWKITNRNGLILKLGT